MEALLHKDTLIKNEDLHSTVLARIYKEKGNSYYEFEEFENAIDNFNKGIEELKKNNNYGSIIAVAELQENIAKIYEKQSRHKEAEGVYRQLLKTYQSLEDGNSTMSAVSNLAYHQSKQAEYNKAIFNYQKTINYYQLINKWDLAGYNLSQVGQSYWSMGLYDSAIYSHQKALSYQQLADNNGYKAYAWGKLGSLYSLSGLKQKGLFAQDSALYYAFKGSDTAAAIGYLIDIGNTYREANEDNKALENLRSAEKLSKKINSKTGLLSAIYNLAGYYYKKDTVMSAGYYRQAATMAVELGDKDKQIYTSLNLGLLQNRQLNFGVAEVFFKKAFTTYLFFKRNNSNYHDFPEPVWRFCGGIGVERKTRFVL